MRLDKKRLVPEDKGRVVTAFLESFFARYVEYDFTADLEEQLDRISNDELAWKDVLRDFWSDFTAAVDDIKDLRIAQVLDALDELLAPHIFPPRADGTDPRNCPTCGTGQLSLKLGKFGAFIGCSNYPECRYTRQLAAGDDGDADGGMQEARRRSGDRPRSHAAHAAASAPMSSSARRDDGEKPKRAGLPEGLAPDDIDLDRALALLSLPREVGKHPEDGEPIIAGIGRFGPYVQHGKTYANLDAGDDVLTVGLNRAVTLIAEKKLKPGKGRRFGADPGRALGEHPDKGGPIVVKNGRYGPYVSHDGVNATLPERHDAGDRHARRGGRAARRARRARGGGKKRAAQAPGAQGSRPQGRQARKPQRASRRARRGQAAQEAGRARPRPPQAKRDSGRRTRWQDRRAMPKFSYRLTRASRAAEIHWSDNPHQTHPLPLQGRAPRLHRRAARQGRQARDRARLRPEERRPRRAQAHAARARRRRPRRAPAQEAASARHAARTSCSPTSPAATATAN